MEKTEMSTPISKLSKPLASKPIWPNPYQLWNSDLSDWIIIEIDWSTKELAYRFKDE